MTSWFFLFFQASDKLWWGYLPLYWMHILSLAKFQVTGICEWNWEKFSSKRYLHSILRMNIYDASAFCFELIVYYSKSNWRYKVFLHLSLRWSIHHWTLLPEPVQVDIRQPQLMCVKQSQKVSFSLSFTSIYFVKF